MLLSFLCSLTYSSSDIISYLDSPGITKEFTFHAGTYILDCWGANGGAITSTFAETFIGKGAFLSVKLTFSSETKLYIFAGEWPSAENPTETKIPTESIYEGGKQFGGASAIIKQSTNSWGRGGGGYTALASSENPEDSRWIRWWKF